MLLSTVFAAGCWATGYDEMIPVVAVIVMLGLSRDWIAVGLHKGGRAAMPLFVQGAVLLGVALLVTSTGAPALAVGCGYAASAAVSVMLNRLPRLDRTVLNSSGPLAPLEPWMLGAVMTNQVLSSSDVLLLGLLGTTAATGVYSAVYRIPNGWLAGVSILAGALLPVATRAASSSERSAQLRRGAFTGSIGSAVVLLAVTPIVYVLIPPIFGSQYIDGRGPVVVLLIATAVATAASPLHQFYLVTGSDRRYAGFLATSAVVIVIAGLLLIPRFSMMGAAFSTLIAHTVLAGVLLVAVGGEAGGRRRTPPANLAG